MFAFLSEMWLESSVQRFLDEWYVRSYNVTIIVIRNAVHILVGVFIQTLFCLAIQLYGTMSKEDMSCARGIFLIFNDWCKKLPRVGKMTI